MGTRQSSAPALPVSIYVWNCSKLLHDEDAALMTHACQLFVPMFCQAWSLAPVSIMFVPSTSSDCLPPPGSWLFKLIEEARDVEGALAYHTEENDKVDGYVMVKTILEDGGVPLYKDDKTETVASALCHEIFEALGDRYCNGWVDDPTGNKQFSLENCDPVQDGIVQVKVGDVTVGLSNFVLPSWFDPELVSGKVDYLGQLNHPFTISPGGYAVVRHLNKSNKIEYVYGHAVKPHKKYPHSNRTLKRCSAT